MTRSAAAASATVEKSDALRLAGALDLPLFETRPRTFAVFIAITFSPDSFLSLVSKHQRCRLYSALENTFRYGVIPLVGKIKQEMITGTGEFYARIDLDQLARL
jgi:hypothetical protein